MKKAQVHRIDEFAFVLLAGIVLILFLMVAWTTPAEPLPKIEPTSVSLEMQYGTSTTFELEISGKVTNVTLTALGEIRNWLSFSKNNFDVKDSTVVTVRVSVPKTVPIGTYRGSVEVASTGGKKAVPVTIEVQRIVPTVLSSRPISLGNFLIGYTSGSKELDSKKDVEVSKGYFSEHSVSLIGTLTDRELALLKDGYVQLIIDDTNRAGNLIVLLNDKEIFNKNVGPGEITIPLTSSDIEKSNTVIIRATSPGWKFWTNTVYIFRTIKFGINYEGAFSKEITFSLKESEINKFQSFQLSYRVKDYSPTLPEMLIKINDQIVFLQRPPLAFFNSTFETDVLGNRLVLHENNTISFSFEKEASYEIANAILTVYYRV